MTQNIGTLQNPKRRYNRIDGWRGYYVPGLAVAGSSDTGTYSDSPCPTPVVLKELNRIRKEVLRPAGIQSRSRIGSSSNLFCAKRWLVVSREDFAKASKLVLDWIEENDSGLRFVHSANQDVYFKEAA